MSKFDELRQCYGDARKEFIEGRDACVLFSLKMVEGFETYLGCPSYHVRFASHTGATTASTAHNALGALWLGADGVWRVRASFDLDDSKSGKDAGRQTVSFEISMQPLESGFSVGIKGWSERFVLPFAAGPTEFAPLYDFIVQRVLEGYHQLGQRFFDGGVDPERTLGA
jgi:hypothetical protein